MAAVPSVLVSRPVELGFSNITEMMQAVNRGVTIDWGPLPKAGIPRALFLKMVEQHGVVLESRDVGVFLSPRLAGKDGGQY